MIDPQAIASYAQFNEDLILRALLSDVKNGFYVDVGANYPTIDSVTKIFYDAGWNGINIEPLKKLHEQLVSKRPRDINLQIGVGDKKGEAMLREYVDVPGHSTFETTQKNEHGESFNYVDYPVKIELLSDVLKKHAPAHIHFIKIDVEGFEYNVIKGCDWKKYRPEVICVEANHLARDWSDMLTAAGYKLFISDGLNEYYVAKECWERTEGFVERIVELEYHALKQHQWQSWKEDSKTLVKLTEIVKQQQDELEAKEIRYGRMRQLSLKDRSWLSRLERAIYGLTIDWVRYKRKR